MNKKLESAMEECAEAFADQEGELISKDGPTGVQDNRKFPSGFLDQWMMRHGYKAGFQKCYEIMARREDKLVDVLRKLFGEPCIGSCKTCEKSAANGITVFCFKCNQIDKILKDLEIEKGEK